MSTVDYQHSQYLGGLPAVALPGGDLAAKTTLAQLAGSPASICCHNGKKLSPKPVQNRIGQY